MLPGFLLKIIKNKKSNKEQLSNFLYLEDPVIKEVKGKKEEEQIERGYTEIQL